MTLDENGNPIPQRRRMPREIEVDLDDPRLTLDNPRTVFAESEDQRYPEFAQPTSPVQNPIDWAIRSADSHKLGFAGNVDLAQALYYKAKGDMDAASAQLGEYDRMQRMATEAGPAIQTREDVDAAGGGVGANVAWLGHQAMGLVPDVLSAVGGGLAGSFAAPGAGTIAGAALPFVGKRAAVSGLREIAKRELASEMGEAAAKRVSGDVLQNRVEALAGRLGAEGVADVGKAALRQQAGRAGRVAGVIAGGVPGVAGGQAEQIKAADQEDAQKLAAATLASSTIGALPFERFFGQFGKKAMDKAMRDTAKFLPRVAKEFGKQGLAEGSAEFAQAVTERLGHKWVDENVEWLSADAFNDYLTNFAAGFAAGGALGAGGEGFRTGGRFVAEKAGQFRDAVKGTIKQLADARRAKRGELTPSEAEAQQSDTEATRAANVATGTERTPRRGPAGSFLARLQRMWGQEKEDRDLSDEADAITQFEVSRRVAPLTGNAVHDTLLSFVDLDNSEFTSAHAVADTLTRYVRGEATDEDFVQIDALGFKPGARNALDLVAERWASQLDAADSMLSEAGSLQDEIEQAERAFGAASADSDAADRTYEDAEAESSRENEYGGINVHDGVPFEENTPLEIQLGNEFSARALLGTPGKVIDEKGAARAEGRARAEQHNTLYGVQGRREAALANKLGVRPTPNERSARRALLDAQGSKGLLGDTNHLGIFGDNVWSSKDETGPNSVAEKIKSPRFVEISADWDNIPEVAQRLPAGDAPRTAIMLDNLVSQVRGQSRGKLTGEQALEKALVDLTLAGVTIDLDTLTPGELKSGKGDVVLNLTEKMVGDLQVAVRKARSGRIQGPLTLDNAYARDQPRKAAGARMPLDEARASAVAEARNAGYPNLAAYAASRQMTISELIERTATRSPQRAAVSVARSLASEDGYQPGDSIDPAEWREYMSRAQAILDDRRANARRDATKFDAGVAREAGSGDFDTEADTALVPRVTPPGASNAIEATRYETEGNGKNAPLGRKIDADGFTPTMSPMVDVGRHTPADTAERISSEEDGDLTDADAKNTKQRLQEGMRLITGERRRFNAYDVADVINEINDVRPGTERAYLIYIAERFADGSPNGVIAKALEARQQRLEESKDIPSEVKSNADAGVEATAARRDKGQRKVDPDAPPIIYDDGNMQRPAKNLMDDLGPAAKPKPSVATRTSARLPTRDEKVDPRPDNRRIPETPGPTTKLAQSPVPPFALRSQDDDGVAHAGPDRNAPRPAMKSVHTKKPQKSTDTIAFEFDETPEGIEFSERVDTLRAKLAQAVGRTDVDAQTRAQLMKSIRRVEQRMQQAREQYAARAKTVTPRGSTKADKDVQEALASPEYTRDTKKLAEVASAILERLGFKTDVSVKTHKSNFSGQMHYVDGKLVLRVGAGLRGAERIEVLTHEIGHHVIHSYIAEAAGITVEDASRMQPNELLAAITKADPKLGAALKADYDKWKASHPKGARALDVRASRAGAARAAGMTERAAARAENGSTKPVQDIGSEAQNTVTIKGEGRTEVLDENRAYHLYLRSIDAGQIKDSLARIRDGKRPADAARIRDLEEELRGLNEYLDSYEGFSSTPVYAAVVNKVLSARSGGGLFGRNNANPDPASTEPGEFATVDDANDKIMRRLGVATPAQVRKLLKSHERRIGKYASNPAPATQNVASRMRDEMAAMEAVLRRAAADVKAVPPDLAGDYEYSFDEWLADNIGRALNKNAEVQGIVGKFFKRVADTLRKLYDTMFNGKAKQFAPAPSVEAFVQSLFDRDVAAVKAVTGDVVSKSTAQAATSTAIALQFASPPPPPPAGTAVTASPAANTPAPTIRSMMRFVRKFLKPEERLILEQAVNRGAINEKMRAFYKDNQLALALMDSAKSGMEARVAMAYLMWQAEKVKFGPQANSVFYNTRDNLREILGVASTGDYAHRIFDDIESGRIEAARKNNTPYSVRDIVQRQLGINSTTQSVVNAVERFQERFVARPWRKFMDSLYSRAAATGVPEMRKLAAMLHRPQFAGEKDRGMLSDTAIVTARYVQAASTVFKSLSKPHQHSVMQLMKRHADAATLAREPQEVQDAVADMRKLFARANSYMKAAGLDFGTLDDFFPVIMDVNTPEAQARLTTLLMKPKYHDAIREFFGSTEDEAADPTGASSTPLPAPDPAAVKYFEKLRADLETRSGLGENVAGMIATNESIIAAIITGNERSLLKQIEMAEARADKYAERPKLSKLIEVEIRYMHARLKQVRGAAAAASAQPQATAAKPKRVRVPSDRPIEELVADLVKRAASDTNDAVQTDGPPQFRAENKRSMQFIYDLGDAADIREFADLQNNDPARMVQSYFEPMVKRAEYVRRFGKQGEKLNAMYKRMQDQGATPEDLDLAKNMVAAATGAYASQGSPVIAMISPELAKRMHGRKSQAFIQGMQAYQNARLLPLSLLSSLMDPLGIALRSGGFDGFWKSFKAGLYKPEIFGGKQPAEIKQMMDQLDVYDYFASHEVLHDLYGAGDNPASRATNDFVFKYNGMSWLQRMTRGMALHAAHGFLLKHGGNMTEHSARYLRELGLKPSDIQGDVAQPGRVRVLTGAERNAAAKAAAKAEVARDDRVRDALRRFADEAVLRPNTMQAPLWHADPYMGLVTQYKSFGYAMWDQLGKRLVREAEFNNPGALGAAVAFLPVVIFAELLRELLMFGTDGNPKRAEWGPAEYGNLAVMRTGLLGPNAAMVEDLYSDVRDRRLPGSSQIGPAASQAAGMVNALRGYGDLAQEVEETLPANPLYKHHINPLSIGAAP